MAPEQFAGDKKVGRSILHEPEQAVIRWVIPRIPRWIEGYHLTMLTLLWSALTVLFGYLARNDLRWLWAISLVIACQWATDSFDGSLGRSRGTGTIKWGFYMDHFLDYLFLSSILLAGSLISPPGLGTWFLVLLLLTGGFMVSSYLMFAATNRFEIAIHGVGPTEGRIGLVLLNTVIIFTGTAQFRIAVPLVCLACAIGLVVVVKRASDELWAIDMANKAQHGDSAAPR